MIKKGIVFDISRGCLSDGEGIRTTVFLKGCPLSCKWCHNPESQNLNPEIMYAHNKCVKCGACVSVCEYDCHIIKNEHHFIREHCVGCGKCASVCVAKALRMVGKTLSVEDVMKEVLKDKAFYDVSCGGLTVSGGEPMMQIHFLESLLQAAKKEGLHTCIETCGYAPQKFFKKVAPLVDCFLFDWKESDSEKHRIYTGFDNYIIRENLYFLDKIGAGIILRLPLVPGYNDTKEHIDGIALVVNLCTSIKKLEILLYHPLGISKEKELGKNSGMDLITVPDKKLIDDFHMELCKKISVDVIVLS